LQKMSAHLVLLRDQPQPKIAIAELTYASKNRIFATSGSPRGAPGVRTDKRSRCRKNMQRQVACSTTIRFACAPHETNFVKHVTHVTR
jgi:hypothetical protein